MENLVLYCKSYRNDVLRARALAESLLRFNTDRIPLYISVPSSDLDLFREHLKGTGCMLLSDEEILGRNPRHSIDLIGDMPGGLLQQVVKSEFWRMEISRNYLLLDSDAFFIRPFSYGDFMFDDETPYTVMHESRDILDFAARRGKRKIIENYRKDRLQGMKIFSRQGRLYDFGPTPIICSSLVWRSLTDNFAEPAGKSFADLIREYPNELIWYGEAMLKYAPIRLMPVEPLFKVFHYMEQYRESQRLGESEKTIAENYLGIIRQSNWDFSLDFIPRKKRSWKTLWLKR